METVYNFPTDAFKSTAVCSSLHYIIIAQIIRFWLLIKLCYQNLYKINFTVTPFINRRYLTTGHGDQS